MKLDNELDSFLFHFRRTPGFQTPLFETFRQAHYSAEAVYNLPYTIEEGLAHKHRISREQFLARIQAQMTPNEKLRLQTSTADMKRVDLEMDWTRLPLTRLVLYILSLPFDERRERADEFAAVLEHAAQAALRKSPLALGKVAAILDCSYSSSGSSKKRRRPLGIALASHYLLAQAAREYRAFWTRQPDRPCWRRRAGRLTLQRPARCHAGSRELIVIVSDGYENDPPCGALNPCVSCGRIWTRTMPCPLSTETRFLTAMTLPPALSPYVPTVGLRDAEDLPTVLGFARFADGSATREELETYLAARTGDLLAQVRDKEEEKKRRREDRRQKPHQQSTIGNRQSHDTRHNITE